MKGILLDNNFGLDVENGTLNVGDITRQCQGFLLLFQPGELKEYPLLGVGIENWLNDENPGSIKAEIRRQFKSDGMTVSSITISNSEFEIDASYE